MGRSVFISYRRKGGEGFAQMFYMLLGQRGYRVFYDIESLGQGLFDERILREIEEAEVFLVILSEGALDRCVNDGDWVRREIAHAIKLGKPIVPILFRGFKFPAQMPQDIAKLARYNGMDFSDMNFFDARTEALIKRIDAAAEAAKVKAIEAETSVEDTEKASILALLEYLTPEQIDLLHKELFDDEEQENETAIDKLTPQTISAPKNAVYAECGRPGLVDVIIPNGVTRIKGKAFQNCVELKSIIIPESVKSIGQSAFYNCLQLTTVNIPNSVTSIKKATFYGCTCLLNVNISSSATSIGNHAFSECMSLTKINIPNGMKSIGECAFSNCRGLTTVSIPNSLTSIGSLAFYNCEKLKTINFGGTRAEWRKIKKDICWDLNIIEYTVHCTNGTISK